MYLIRYTEIVMSETTLYPRIMLDYRGFKKAIVLPNTKLYFQILQPNHTQAPSRKRLKLST